MVIYKTTNLINGKIYIGQDLYNNPKYLGSGTAFKKAIKKYGIENFIKDVLEVVPDDVEAFEREDYWVEFYNSRNKTIGYNIAKPSKAFWTDCHHTEKSKSIISEKLINNKNGLGKECSEEKRKKISISNTGKIRTAEMLKNLSNAHIGVKLSDEAKRKLSEYSGEKAPFFNKTHSEESILKIKKKLYATYTIETPTGEIIEIESRKSVLEYLKCSEGFFTIKSFKGYKLLNVSKKYE